jgi:hypothetical protein
MPMKSQNLQPCTLVKRRVLAVSLTVAALFLFGSITLLTAPSASAKEIQRLPHEPNNPKVLQVYFNTTDNREYIYNGQEWVPHDASIDTYVLKKYKKPTVPKKSSTIDGADTSATQGVAQ